MKLRQKFDIKLFKAKLLQSRCIKIQALLFQSNDNDKLDPFRWKIYL